MKPFFYIIILIIFAVSTKAQNAELIATTWHLQYINDDGSNTFPPYEFESGIEGELTFSTTEYHYDLCTYFEFGDISYSLTGNNFTLSDSGSSAGGCGTFEGEDFLDRYNDIYDYFKNSNRNPFTYTIDDAEASENTSSTRILTISNGIGEFAVYGNAETLSQQHQKKLSFKIFPNPTQKKLYIESNQTVKTVKIYALDGQLVHQSLERIIDVTSLASGLYFVEVTNHNQSAIHKMIKR